MAALLIYIIRWGVALALLYSCYGLLLRRETFHRFNRVVLNVILVSAMVLPLCEIESSRSTPIAEPMEWVESNIVPMEFDFEEACNVLTDVAPIRPDKSISIGKCVIVLYLAGTLAFLLHYFFSLVALARIICNSQRIASRDGVTVCINSRLSTSCSWMRWIILNAKPDSPESRMILAHETAHVRLRHSWDMLLAEVTARLLWPLPFAWMLRSDLRAVHEYEADQYVVRHGAEREEYGLMLIHSVTRTSPLTIANSFSNHSIKDRLKMMYRKQSTRRAALKATYLLPLAALAVTAFARPTAMEEIEQIVESEAPEIHLPSFTPPVETKIAPSAQENIADTVMHKTTLLAEVCQIEEGKLQIEPLEEDVQSLRQDSLAIAPLAISDNAHDSIPDTTVLNSGDVAHARYCLTYDDFVNNRWNDAGHVRVKVKHGRKRLSSGKQEFRFKASNRKLTATLHDDALVVKVGAQLYINQQYLYHYASHFGNNYTPCFAVGKNLVFVGDMRFGDRPNEVLGPVAFASSGRIYEFSIFGTAGPATVVYVTNHKKFVHLETEYELANGAGVYCFMVNSNSINTVKLNEDIDQILAGQAPTPVRLNRKDQRYLDVVTRGYAEALKPRSEYRQW